MATTHGTPWDTHDAAKADGWMRRSEGGVVIYERDTHDRSDGEVSYTAAEAGGEFEPWNGDHGATGEFLPLVIR